MSMTTEFIEKLRKDATALYDSEVLINQRIESQCVKDMREAADMIEELSLKLHNSQMERSSQFYHDGWIPVSERLPEDGCWAIFTDGKNISIERYKKDAFNHFFPSGRWFELENAIAWTPLPEPYKESEVIENE